MQIAIYKAKIARRPARPAPAMRAEFMSAAPVNCGLAPEPEVADDPVAQSESSQSYCPMVNLPGEAVASAELVAEAAALAPLDATASPPGAKAVWLLGKRLLMQPSTHFPKARLSSVDPSPWSQLAAHSLVSITCEALGRALPKQPAWQVTSPALHAETQLRAGDSPVGIAAAAGALVMEASWGRAKTPTAKARMAEYFIMTVVLGDVIQDEVVALWYVQRKLIYITGLLSECGGIRTNDGRRRPESERIDNRAQKKSWGSQRRLYLYRQPYRGRWRMVWHQC